MLILLQIHLIRMLKSRSFTLIEILCILKLVIKSILFECILIVNCLFNCKFFFLVSTILNLLVLL